jgi:uncharacterized membrane protein YbhN (UPF0104 family)
MRHVRSGWLRLLGGVGLVALLVWRLGADPFVAGVRAIDGGVLVAAVLIGIPTTVCCAWRWRLVSRGLGVTVSPMASVASYYRSQFLNTTLPGGVLGDVHRGVRHGRAARATGRALRAVVWERFAGLVVLVTIAVAALLVLPWPGKADATWTLLAPVVVAVCVVSISLVLVASVRRFRTAGRAGLLRTLRSDLRDTVLARGVWPGVAGASALAVVGHVVAFVVAARAAGVTASPVQLLPPVLLVLVAMAIPANIAGWGPREGMSAWAFGASGLGADQGISTAVVYGVMALVASLPGAAVLLGGWLLGRAAATRGALHG